MVAHHLIIRIHHERGLPVMCLEFIDFCCLAPFWPALRALVVRVCRSALIRPRQRSHCSSFEAP